MSRISENNFTGRQSRLSMLVEGKISNAKLTGYVETDFLGTGVTSNNRQSNSYVLRQRQFWGRIDLDNGWAFSGGQMWSLATENQKGIVNRNEWIPLTIDAQYQVGFNWAREYGLARDEDVQRQIRGCRVHRRRAGNDRRARFHHAYDNEPIHGWSIGRDKLLL